MEMKMNESEPTDGESGDPAVPSTWRSYLPVVIKFLVIYYVITFAILMWVMYSKSHSHLLLAIIGVSYLAFIFISFIRIIRTLPLVAIMLAAPIVPLCMLLLVLSMFPLLQLLAPIVR